MLINKVTQHEHHKTMRGAVAQVIVMCCDLCVCVCASRLFGPPVLPICGSVGVMHLYKRSAQLMHMNDERLHSLWRRARGML